MECFWPLSPANLRDGPLKVLEVALRLWILMLPLYWLVGGGGGGGGLRSLLFAGVALLLILVSYLLLTDRKMCEPLMRSSCPSCSGGGGLTRLRSMRMRSPCCGGGLRTNRPCAPSDRISYGHRLRVTPHPWQHFEAVDSPPYWYEEEQGDEDLEMLARMQSDRKGEIYPGHVELTQPGSIGLPYRWLGADDLRRTTRGFWDQRLHATPEDLLFLDSPCFEEEQEGGMCPPEENEFARFGS